MIRIRMTRLGMTRGGKTLTAALLAGTALTTAAWAQFGGGPRVPPAAPAGMPMPGAPNMPGGGPSMPNAPMSGGRNMPGAPFGMGRLPFASGTVTSVDAAAGTVLLAPMFGGGMPQTIKVTDATQITATREGTVGDLKVGDTIQVRGVPTGMTATQITAGESTDPIGGGMGMMPMGPRLGGRLGGGRSGLGGQAAFAQATGKITGLSPLTVSVSDSVQVTLRVGSDVKVSRNVTEKISDLKAGDRVMANGRAGEDGILAASHIRVNTDYSMGPH